LARLRRAALFHDIGKVGVSRATLAKPAALNEEEWAEVKTHPQVGAAMLHHAGLTEEARFVRQHHEHFDGRGYPDGLSGADIPIESRIILVVDAFDAMTTDRPYRVRLPVEEAARRLRENKGTQFDPRIVEAFLETVVGNLPLYQAV
jgi:polar amino acid transport system substrate-binding protein